MPREVELRREYERRFHRVMAFIDENLGRRIGVGELAREAAFSEFHFHRLFTAYHGETIGDYMARRRVEVAAMRLRAQPRLPVIEVAYDVGFGSPEAFSRAFKHRFGLSPRNWLQSSNSKLDHVKAPANGYGARMSLVSEVSPPDVELRDLPPARFVYRRYQGAFGPPLTRFWREQVMPWLENQAWLSRVRFGVWHDDPGLTPPAKCRYDAGVQLAVEEADSVDTQVADLPGGQYAATRFRGTASEIVGVWNAVLRDWLPASGFQLDGRPFMERYLPDYRRDVAAGTFECDILVPVIRLGGTAR
jgi:AraC family transcriptional regulator